MDIEIVAGEIYIHTHTYTHKGILIRIQIETKFRLPGMLKAKTYMKKYHSQ